MKWFSKQGLIVKLLLLLIPAVNWITEIAIRWTNFLKKGSILNLIFAIFVTVGGGIVMGYLDAIFVLISGKVLFQ